MANAAYDERHLRCCVVLFLEYKDSKINYFFYKITDSVEMNLCSELFWLLKNSKVFFL